MQQFKCHFLVSGMFMVVLNVNGCGGPSSAESRLMPVAVDVATATEMTQKVLRRYSGYTHPWESHGVGFLAAGRVTSIGVNAGETVKAGQLLATLAPDDYSLYTELAAVQTEALAPNLKRVEELVAKKVLPQSQLDEIRGKYQAALTQEKQAKLKLGYTRLVAPIDGVVMQRLSSVGQVIGPGMPVVVILNLKRLKIEFGIPQNDLAYFSEGQEVSVNIPGTDQAHPGSVDHIDLVPDLNTHTFKLVVALDNAAGSLRAGMLAHMEVPIREVTGVFVPLLSLRRGAEGEASLMVLDPQTSLVRRQAVTLGELIGDKINIFSGLKSGDQYVVRGQAFLEDGAKVKVQ